MDELRVTAAYYIKESDMTKAAKLQLMNFLENEATDAQVMALLLDGEIQGLDEMAEEVVYDRFDAALLDEAGLKAALKHVGQEFKRGYKTVKGARKSGSAAAKSKGLSKKAAKKQGSAAGMRAYYKMLAPGEKGVQRQIGRIAARNTRKLPFGKSPAAKRAAAAMRG